MTCRSRRTAAALAIATPILGIFAGTATAQRGSGSSGDEPQISRSAIAPFRARLLGPGLMSGRISDFAVNPDNPAEYYAGVASGGVWKTSNNGLTWQSVFDGQPVYSIGVIEMDPNDTNTLWVGTGENNSQRSVAWGNGVYKSNDGGRSWKHMGLDDSEHIGMIVIHPDDSDTVYVASQGPLWNAGGDRGLYKTTDGGESWERILHISEHTGINEVWMDPEDPDTLYASAYQRRRRVWTLINGGPESGVWKSTDGGDTWREINRGLPSSDMGRIGLAVSADPDILYAIIEAAGGQSGFFRSTNKGETWSRMSNQRTSSPQYYNELQPDPVDPDKVYLMDTFLQVSDDGGRTWGSAQGRGRHVDNHCLWINPDNTDHLLVGCDGGVYDSWDGGTTWIYRPNLPIMQFYKVAIDNSEPFYYVYGGTQDNNTIGGPSRTHYSQGISNEDWFVTTGGDGFEPAIDWENPDIVYSQSQYGGLVRHDRSSGEVTSIKPAERPGDAPYVFNWDSPLIVSPHMSSRVYFGGDRMFRSDDYGNNWKVISGDLTRGIDRNTLEVMGRIQMPGAVAKHDSTSVYGNTTAFDESPISEDLLYVGTDDGLIWVTDNAGGEGETNDDWTRIDSFKGVPEMTYVAAVHASPINEDQVFAVFNNHKNGDFSPYLMRSDDRGETWVSIVGDLPEDGPVWAIRQDHVNEDLLFCGTEFAGFVSFNGGDNWLKIGGIPPIAVRDIEIQRDWDDVVFATFGRGFYVLDDYGPMREMTPKRLKEDAAIFSIRPTPLYIPANKGRGNQGGLFWTADNPSYGAMITYSLGNSYRTMREDRLRAERRPGAKYPTLEQLQEEDAEQAPLVHLTIRDADFNVLNRLPVGRTEGVRRVTWDLNTMPMSPVTSGRARSFGGARVGPGTYSVTLDIEEDGEISQLAGPVEFEVYSLGLATLEAEDHAEVMAFKMRAGELAGKIQAAGQIVSDVNNRIGAVRAALIRTPGTPDPMLKRIESIRQRMGDLNVEFSGDRVASGQDLPTGPSISGRTRSFGFALNRTTGEPTGTQRDQYEYASEEFADWLPRFRQLVEDLMDLEAELDGVGAPWTPGRFPEWDGDN
ncbi:MAG: glycosyl hydrolase [Planctomycetota bacterium]